MSAICGAWLFHNNSPAADVCERLLAQLKLHGPDNFGVLPQQTTTTRANIAFGHRLRRLTQEDLFESQPIVLPDGSWLVTDARVDNRQQLAATLFIPGSELPSLPDSALVAHAWQRWEADCVHHITGAFALAVWSPRQQQLFLARDHSGERPLYFRRATDSVLFASTARAIRSCPGVSSELDQRQLLRDLIGIPPEYPATRFREISQLAPGHCLTLNTSGQTYRRYWDVDHLPPVRFASDRDYTEAFLEIFDEAVRCRLRSTSAVATELSSGLDSGAVTATAARILATRNQSLTAYTAVPVREFNGPVPSGCIADESRYAAEVALLYPNLRHVLIDSSASDMLREFARIFPLLDLPHAAGLNSVWSNLILDHARAAGANVLLTGALGNFTVSYSGADLPYTTFRRGHLLRTARTVAELRRIGISSGRNAASLTLLSLLPWSLRCRFDPLVRDADISWAALHPDRAQQDNALDQLRRYHFTRSGPLPYLMQVQFLNNQYGDYNAATLAGWGIEVRDPTADRRVFEFCASIPHEQFVAGSQSRSLIRRAMQGRLPASTLNRTDKGIQSADYYVNLTRIRAELLAEIALLEASPGARRLLDLDLLRSAVEHWPTDAVAAAHQAGIYQSALPRGLAVGTFIRRIEAETAAAEPL